MRFASSTLMGTMLAVLLSGCSSLFGVGQQEFGCKGLPEGTQCMSAKEVYAATEHADRITNRRSGKSGNVVDGSGDSDSAAPPAAEYRSEPVPTLDRPIPILTQAQVMRIWIAPWDDTDTDLHASEFVYTEVVKRKWNIGDMQIMTGTGALNPLAGSGREQKVTLKSPLAESPKK